MIRNKLLIYPLTILIAVMAATIPGAVDAMFRRPTPQPVVTIPPPSATYPATQVTAVVTAIAHTPSMTPTVTAMWFECYGGVCPSLTPIQVTAVEITVLPPFMPMDASQVIYYLYGSSPSSGLHIDVYGYSYPR